MKKHQLVTLLALGIVYVVWGSTFFGVKLGLEGGITPFFLIGLRFLVAGAVLYAVNRLRGALPPTGAEWRQAGGLSFLLLVCGPGLVAWSEQHISSSLAALLVATSPVWVTVLDRSQRLTARKWLGVILGLVGVGWLVGASLSFDGDAFLWGCLACLVSALTWAIGSLRARRPTGDSSPMMRASMQMLWAGGMLLLGAFATEGRLPLESITKGAWLSLGYLTIFGSLVAYSAYTWLVGNVSAAVLSTHAYVNPVVAVLLGALLGGETLTAQTGMAAFVAMLGVVILMLPTPVKRQPILALATSGAGSGPTFANSRRRTRRRAS